MEIRPYVETDAQATLSVFLAAVTETAAPDYSAEQIAAWARPDERDVNQWNSARKASNTYVATIGADVAGFSNVGDDGYIDMMFVAPKFGRCGVGSALLSHLHAIAARAGASELQREHYGPTLLRTARVHRRRRAAPHPAGRRDDQL